MILLTMGTYPLPFDRMVEAVDLLCKDGLIEDEIFAQIGYTKYIPRYMKYEKLLEKERFDSILSESSALIGHAGMGTITLALEYGKPLLVMPRLKKYGEHVNDHQLGTAVKFEELGCILVAYEEKDLPEKINALKTFVPTPRENQPDRVAKRIQDFLTVIDKGLKKNEKR